MQKYINSAKKTLQKEIEGIQALIDKNLDEKYIKLIDLILSIKGRVIFSGMGKSGHIASKLAATFASTGTPSFYIHPGEASHGDLGMITKEDVVILLSNSGETAELKDIIYYCKKFSIPLVGIVRRKTSILVEHSDISLILPEIEEANEINAPTTSTTMMLALGDAIAVSLINAKGFTKENFGNFHPGGKLGQKFIKIFDIMKTGKEIPLIKENQKMSQAIIEISTKKLGCVGVIDDKYKLIGIITDGDLRRNMREDFLQLNVNQIMTKNPTTIDKNILVVEAINIMNKKSITDLFIIDENNQPKGILHLHDCLKCIS